MYYRNKPFLNLVNLRDQVWPVSVVKLGIIADQHLVQVLNQERVARLKDQHVVVHLLTLGKKGAKNRVKKFLTSVHAQRHLMAHAVLEVARERFRDDEVGVDVDATPLQDDQEPDKV